MKRPHELSPLAFLSDELDALAARGLRRSPAEPLPPDALSFCSNDYLGLASRTPPPAASGSGASRLIAGERVEHRRAERAFADYVGMEDALVFTSGYAANVGVVSALARPGDLLVSDALNHASLIDGARLSKARVAVVPHNDVGAVAEALRTRTEDRAFVVVESYFSMDADGPDLAALRRVCDEHRAALVVDEAHALGLLGPGGRGRAAEAGVKPDVIVGTFGKAFGGQGAFAAGPAVLRDWLWNRARSFVFSTGLAPVSAAAATRGLEQVIHDEELVARVLALAVRFREGLVGALSDAAGREPALRALEVLGFGHVVPVLVGSPDLAMRLAAHLRARGIIVQAVRPPTVPEGTSRLRMTVTGRHVEADIDHAVDVWAESLDALAADLRAGATAEGLQENAQ